MRFIVSRFPFPAIESKLTFVLDVHEPQADSRLVLADLSVNPVTVHIGGKAMAWTIPA
jgi:hypothetical protein